MRSVAQRVGRAELAAAGDTHGTNHSEFEVDLNAASAATRSRPPSADMLQALADFPGVNFTINTFLTERIKETFSGYTAPVVVNVFGNDLDLLDRKAREIAKVLARRPRRRSTSRSARRPACRS